MSLTAEIAAVRARAECVYTSAQVEHAFDRMAADVAAAIGDSDPVLIAVLMGGMYPAVQLARRLDFPYQLDCVHATRYRGRTSGSDLHWVKAPAMSLKGREVLLVDDILDEGKTLAAVADWCIAQKAKDVKIAVLAVKKHDRCVPGLKADYVGVDVTDRYVFGFGMDYYEQGRNLPAIYAI